MALGCSTSTEEMTRPATWASRPRRTTSTSGSSGTSGFGLALVDGLRLDHGGLRLGGLEHPHTRAARVPDQHKSLDSSTAGGVHRAANGARAAVRAVPGRIHCGL